MIFFIGFARKNLMNVTKSFMKTKKQGQKRENKKFENFNKK